MEDWLLRRLVIREGFLDGLDLEFPPGLTCIIGPRGSGKSTLVEAIRYALAHSRSGSRSAPVLIQANLRESRITIETRSPGSGDAYQVRRDSGQLPQVTKRLSSDPIAVDLAHGTFLPLDAYSGSEIEELADESLGDKRRGLLDDLCKGHMAGISTEIANWRSKLESNGREIKQTRTKITELGERIAALSDAEKKLNDLPPAPAGAAHEALDHLTKQVAANREEVKRLDDFSRLAQGYHGRTSELLKDVSTSGSQESPQPPRNSDNQELMSELEFSVAQCFQQATNYLKLAETELRAIPSTIDEFRQRLLHFHGGQEQELNKLQEEYWSASKAAKDRFATQSDVTELHKKLKEQEQENEKLAQLENEREQLKAAYLKTVQQVSDLRSKTAEGLQTDVGDKVRIRVMAGQDNLAYRQMLIDALPYAGVKRHEEIADTCMQMEPGALARLIRSGDLDGFRAQVKLTGSVERPAKVFHAFREKIDSLDLEIVPFDDMVRIELNVAPHGEPHFKDAAELSRGQKCTALLPLLLARRGVPLLIDQPEDNLDNHFIYETVVARVRWMKDRRQMIFATHNANIPVLGEAELIVVLDSDGRKGVVKKSGNVNQCRKEIIDLLEGGEQAFKLRRQWYER